MTWLAMGEPLSLEYHPQSAPTALPSDLRNTTKTIGHLVAQRMIPSPTKDKFVGVIEQVTESFHDLLAEELESPFGFDSSRGSHHPSRECFMTGTPEGHVENIHEEEDTPTNDLDNKVEGHARAPPRLWVEQLKAQHQELEEARL